MMHLIDSFMPLIAYVVIFQRNVVTKQPSFEQVKADVQRLLYQSESSAKKSTISPEEYDQARFMVCAWVDEALLGSNWTQKNLWQREQLQRIYYNTTDAGVEVFDRLNNLGFHQKDVREIYYYCLSLGFKGRFIHTGDEFLLEQLRLSNLKILTGSSAGVPSLDRMELFPEAFPVQVSEIAQQRAPFKFSMVTIIALVGPVVLIGLLYLVYWFTLSSVAGKIF
jgi:type VI secretion system protein ImpK